MALLQITPAASVTWVVLSASGERRREALASAEEFLGGAADADIRILDFTESFLPFEGGSVKEAFESLKDVEPDLIFTHARHDLHQDHRLACELTWNTFRDHMILEYEVPKYDGDLGVPNTFFPLSDDFAERKLELLRKHFTSQAEKHWFDEELLRSLLRIRGMESATRYAEAFTCRKLQVVAT